MAISGTDESNDRPRRILHITKGSEYDRQRAAGQVGFVDPSLETEGFTHCSTADQFLIPANERFGGMDDLVLLVIEADKLTEPLVYEDCYESGLEFPHVYGPIAFDAVVDMVPLVPDENGQFTEPRGLRDRL